MVGRNSSGSTGRVVCPGRIEAKQVVRTNRAVGRLMDAEQKVPSCHRLSARHPADGGSRAANPGCKTGHRQTGDGEKFVELHDLHYYVFRKDSQVRQNDIVTALRLT